MATDGAAWRTCNSCKGDIAFDETYYVCSVSTCNRKGSDFRFCSIECWDEHVPVMRHREAFAEERRAPTRAAWEREQAEDAPPPPRTSPQPTTSPSSAPRPAPTEYPAPVLSEAPREVLVVTSKLKQYIRARSGMNTSDSVIDVLSEKLREIADGGIRRAAAAGRKTVMDRDFD